MRPHRRDSNPRPTDSPITIEFRPAWAYARWRGHVSQRDAFPFGTHASRRATAVWRITLGIRPAPKLLVNGHVSLVWGGIFAG